MNKINKNIYFNLVGDSSFEIQIAVTIISVVCNLDKSMLPIFFVFTRDEFNIKLFRYIEDKYNCKINIINVKKYDYIFKDQNQNKFDLKYISIITYYRLLAFKILPSYVDKLIYLDSDMIVDTDLSNLYSEMDKLFAAVVEIHAYKFCKTNLCHLNYYEEFGNFNSDISCKPYFNAGFYIVNIKKCTKLKVFNDMVYFLNKYKNPRYADQDILNYVFGQKYSDSIQYLHPKYNVFCNIIYKIYKGNIYYTSKEILRAFKHPLIYHFSGELKPWTTKKTLNYYKKWWKYERKLDKKYQIFPPTKLRTIKLFGLITISKKRVKI